MWSLSMKKNIRILLVCSIIIQMTGLYGYEGYYRYKKLHSQDPLDFFTTYLFSLVSNKMAQWTVDKFRKVVPTITSAKHLAEVQRAVEESKKINLEEKASLLAQLEEQKLKIVEQQGQIGELAGRLSPVMSATGGNADSLHESGAASAVRELSDERYHSLRQEHERLSEQLTQLERTNRQLKIENTQLKVQHFRAQDCEHMKLIFEEDFRCEGLENVNKQLLGTIDNLRASNERLKKEMQDLTAGYEDILAEDARPARVTEEMRQLADENRSLKKMLTVLAPLFSQIEIPKDILKQLAQISGSQLVSDGEEIGEEVFES